MPAYALENLLQKVRTVRENIPNYIKEAVANSSEAIIDANVSQLYDKGINRLGVSIMDYAPYTPATVAIKRAKGQPTNRVTLRDTGDFHNDFFIKFRVLLLLEFV